MRVNKPIGEVGIKHGEQLYLLRPSFYALSQLGSPSEIVRKYKLVCHYFECATGARRMPRGVDRLAGYGVCFETIQACCEVDVSPLLGRMSYNGKRGLRHVQGAIPYMDIVVLALHLMRYAIYGNPKPRKGQKGEELTDFEPASYVGMAVGQFGMSLSDAWNLTMVEYQRAFDGKYPQPEEEKYPDKKEYADAMAWHDEVKAARAKKAARQ